MAHDGTTTLRGSIGLPDGNEVALLDENLADELRREHISLPTDPGDNEIIELFVRFHFTSSPPSQWRVPDRYPHTHRIPCR